jgi:DHA1 family inner membrane transport protein
MSENEGQARFGPKTSGEVSMMIFFANRDINRLAVHTALVSLAWSLAGIFFTVFLLRAGLPPAQIFLAAAAILALRFALRPLVVILASAIGLRRAFILGTFLSAIQFPAIAFVHGVGLELVLFCLISSLSQVFYWTCYHVLFASLGDIDHRGKQIGARQALGALAGVIGPAAGGVMLTVFGPWVAFGAAFAVQIVAIFPLLHIEEPKIAQTSPLEAYASARLGIILFFADGWIQSGSATAWSIVMFQALAARYDNFGGVLSVAALGGAVGGMILGRVIDMGHGRRSVWLNAGILATGLILKSTCDGHPIAVVGIAVGTTLFSGLYLPYWMTAVYNAGKNAPCTFRFHFASEGGWDAGGFLASLVAAAVCAAKLPIEVVILLALPMVVIQALLLVANYKVHDRIGRVGSVFIPRSFGIWGWLSATFRIRP